MLSKWRNLRITMNYPSNKLFFFPLLIILLGLVVYGGVLHAPFQFDDKSFVLDNPLIHDMKYYWSPAEAASIRNSYYAPFLTFFQTRFVGYFTLALNYSAHGHSVVGYHVVNLVVHLLNALLVYCLLLLICRTPRMRGFERSGTAIPLFAALLFVAHPVQTEAVTYISQRFASLATTFYLLAIIFYFWARISEGQDLEDGPPPLVVLFFILSFCCGVAAMKTKEISFTLPISAMVCEAIFFEGRLGKRCIRLLPLLSTLFIIPYSILAEGTNLRDFPGSIDAASRSRSDMPRLVYFMTETRVIMTYVRLILWPINQNLDYDYPVYRSFPEPAVLLSLSLVAVVISAAVFVLTRTGEKGIKSGVIRLSSFGIFWFFITLSVESSFIPIEDVIFEHRLYLPSVGAFITLSAVLQSFMWIMKNTSTRRVVIALISVIVFSLAVAAFIRNQLWCDNIALWTDVVKKSPGKVRGYNNLGFYYFEQSMLEKARETFLTTVRLRPDYAKGYHNVGMVYWKEGNTDLALDYFKRASALDPNDALTQSNLGLAYMAKGLEEKAEEHFRRAYKLRGF